MRQKMFKLFSIVLALILCICCLSACGNDNNNNNGGNSTNEGYYVDEETGKIIDATTGETTDENLTVDETTGNIVDKETGEIVQTKEESDKIKEEATNPNTNETKPQETTKPSETTKTENVTNKEDKNDKTDDTNTSNPTETTKPSEPTETTCKHTETKVLNKTDATCDRAGYTGDTYCKKCNILISYGSHIQATGHKNTELRNAKEATTESEGYTGDTYCKDCKKTIITGSVISKLYKEESLSELRARTMAEATKSVSHQFYDIEQEVLRLVNIERSKVGLTPVQWYEDAYCFVKIRAEESVALFSHTRPDGRSWHTVYHDANVITNTTLENLHYTQSAPLDLTLASRIVEGWMNSSGHKANILNANVNLMTVSIVKIGDKIVSAQHFFN